MQSITLDPLLDSLPIFSFPRPVPQSCELKSIFVSLPSNKSQLVEKAEKCRNIFVKQAKAFDCLHALRCYFLSALSLEHEQSHVNPLSQIPWIQSSIFALKPTERNLPGAMWDLEILQLIWFEAILDRELAIQRNLEGNRSGASDILLIAAGVFQFLALELPRHPHAISYLPEFNSYLFIALMLFSLAESYSLTASIAEMEGVNRTFLSHFCYVISITYGAVQTELKRIGRPLITIDFVNWVMLMKQFHRAASAVFLGLEYYERQEYGAAVGLIKFAKAELSYVPTDKGRKKSNELDFIEKLRILIESLESQWETVNFNFGVNKSVPSIDEAELKLSEDCTLMPALRQPPLYQLPNPEYSI